MIRLANLMVIHKADSQPSFLVSSKQSSISVPKVSSVNGRPSLTQPHDAPRKRLAIIGAAAVDIVSLPGQAGSDNKKSGENTGLVAKTTVPGTTAIRLGGVARNVHEAAFKTGATDAVLIAPIGKGDDPLANILRDGLSQLGASHEGLIEMNGDTPSVNMVLDGNGTLAVGVAATQLVEQLTWNAVSRLSV